MPVVIHLRWAIVVATAGATVIWLVESDRPVSWVVFQAVLYGVVGFLGYHWGRPPMFLDRITQAIGALFPALACVVGALVAGRQRATRREAQTSPDYP